MRTKRSTGSKKTTARGTRTTTARKTAAAAPESVAAAAAEAPAAAAAESTTKLTTWIAGIDGLSLGIAGAAIVAAGILVAAYRPTQPEEVTSRTSAATQETPKADAPFDAQYTATASPKAINDGTHASNTTWPAPVSITGCLDRDGDSYRLTGAAGPGLQKSRSWKSAFLKKNASSITIVDAGRRARLQDHLGQRVTVTGTMVNREMQVGSMRLLSESCSEKTKI